MLQILKRWRFGIIHGVKIKVLYHLNKLFGQTNEKLNWKYTIVNQISYYSLQAKYYNSSDYTELVKRAVVFMSQCYGGKEPCPCRQGSILLKHTLNTCTCNYLLATWSNRSPALFLQYYQIWYVYTRSKQSLTGFKLSTSQETQKLWDSLRSTVVLFSWAGEGSKWPPVSRSTVARFMNISNYVS